MIRERNDWLEEDVIEFTDLSEEEEEALDPSNLEDILYEDYRNEQIDNEGN